MSADGRTATDDSQASKEVRTMPNTTGQPVYSIVFTDHERNCYVIPAEIFERGRVPVARVAEVEELLREQEVVGHNPFVVDAGVALAGAAVGGTLVATGVVRGVAIGYGLASSGTTTAPPANNTAGSEGKGR
jgi:hypothetical protein